MNIIARRDVFVAASVLLAGAGLAAVSITTAHRLAGGNEAQQRGEEYAAPNECWSAAPAVTVSPAARPLVIRN